jgi:hypothetical protein
MSYFGRRKLVPYGDPVARLRYRFSGLLGNLEGGAGMIRPSLPE